MLHSGHDFLETIRTVLEKDLPKDKVERICFELSDIAGGGAVYISKQLSSRLSVRNQGIVDDFKSGFSLERLSTKYLLSTRQIRRVISHE